MLPQALALHLPGGLHCSLNAGGVEHWHGNRQGDHAMHHSPEDIAIALYITRSQNSGINSLLYGLLQHPKARNARLALILRSVRQEIGTLHKHELIIDRVL